MDFNEYLREAEKKTKISKEDKDKAIEAGLKTAQKVFGKEYSKDKAMKVINGLIDKHKDDKDINSGDDLSAILQNAFR